VAVDEKERRVVGDVRSESEDAARVEQGVRACVALLVCIEARVETRASALPAGIALLLLSFPIPSSSLFTPFPSPLP
jgi:hypothetical protein